MSPVNHEPLRILAVDDREDDLNLLLHLLERTDIEIAHVDCASDGASSIAKASEGSWDILFLDYDLPDMTGLEVLSKVLATNPDQQVIMLTALGSEQIAVSALKAGAMDYLVKGVLNRDSLEASILALLDRRQLRDTVREQAQLLIDAERQRVMMESIGATCHHFSQPVTSLMGRLELLLARDQVDIGKTITALSECLECTRQMADLLNQFQRVREYRTRPYLENIEILDIGPIPSEGRKA